MNTEYFIAKRLSLDKTNRSRLLQLMSYISLVSVALSLTVMIVSMAVLKGFKTQIQDKVTGFNAQLSITNFDTNHSFEKRAIRNNYPFYDTIRALPEVRHMQQFASKNGIIRTDEEIQGIVLKGVGTDYDWSFFNQYLTEGELFTLSDTATTNKVLISESLSTLLKLKVGDQFKVFFVQDPVRMREFTISGLYSTNFDELDRRIVLCDIRHIRKLNGWAADEVSGMEIMLHSVDQLEQAYPKIDDLTYYRTLDDGSRLQLISILEAFPQLFNWLAIIDMNVLVIIVLMLVVAGFNMVSGLLILLLEKISMIGLLKALGMTSSSVRKIFIYRSGVIVFRGILWGNFIGIGLCLLQQHFGIVKLDPQNYYFSVAPVELSAWTIIALNIGAFIFILLVQLLPSMLVSRISPDKTIRME